MFRERRGDGYACVDEVMDSHWGKDPWFRKLYILVPVLSLTSFMSISSTWISLFASQGYSEERDKIEASGAVKSKQHHINESCVS
jgi:hypothetical protein